MRGLGGTFMSAPEHVHECVDGALQLNAHVYIAYHTLCTPVYYTNTSTFIGPSVTTT